MKTFNRIIKIFLLAAIVIGIGTFVVFNYSWVFSKRISGRILDVQRVTDPSAMLGSKLTQEQLHSYAVLIQGDDGHLYTASSEDRQWQVAKKGYCVVALLYRYPFWDLQHADTFFNAQLKELKVCPGEQAPDLLPQKEESKPVPDKPQMPPANGKAGV